MRSLSLSLVLVGNAAHQPTLHPHPGHHVHLLCSDAACGQPPQRHRLQLRALPDRRHGESGVPALPAAS